MVRHRPQSRHLPLTQRVSAGGLAALIFVLGLLAASPAWHGLLHAGATDHHDHTSPDAATAEHLCVISDFAHGVTPALTFIAVEQPVVRPAAHAPVAIALQLPPTRWLLQPGRAPPAV